MSYQWNNTKVFELHSADDVIAKAQEVKDEGGTRGERKLKPDRMAKIKDCLLTGLTIPFSWAMAGIPGTGQKFREDGQHSCEVFLTMTDEEWSKVTFPVIIIYHEFACETEVDVALLFEQFNARWSSRSDEDQIGAHLAFHPELLGESGEDDRYAADKATKGIRWYLHDIEGYHGAALIDHFQLIHANSNINRFLRFCGERELHLRRNLSFLAKPYVIAAMYHTTQFGTDEDRTFWRKVAGGTSGNVDDTSVEAKLAAFLEQNHSCKGEWVPKPETRFFRNKKKPNTMEVFGMCLRAFAAYKAGIRPDSIVTSISYKSGTELVRKLWPVTQAQQQQAAAD